MNGKNVHIQVNAFNILYVHIRNFFTRNLLLRFGENKNYLGSYNRRHLPRRDEEISQTQRQIGTP